MESNISLKAFFYNRLCVPCGILKEFYIWEAHGERLMGHGVAKKLTTLQEHFYWPNMKRGM